MSRQKVREHLPIELIPCHCNRGGVRVKGYTFVVGRKIYELSNHLGNVLSTISDRKIQASGTGGVVDYYLPDVRTMTDYYPFGMAMDGRTETQAGTEAYRFGFNGQERIDEIYGDGNSTTAEFWQYDARIGRRWNVDPIIKDWESSYSTFSNNPVLYSDPNGDDIHIKNKKTEVEYRDGKLYNLDGSDYTGKVKGFLKKTVEALDKIKDGGPAGKELISTLQSKEKPTTTIVRTFDGNSHSAPSNVVSWNPSITESGLDENGGTSRPAFIGLAHELSHAADFVDDGKMIKGIWFTLDDGQEAGKREIFASHFENRIRAEQGLPLRKYYTANANEDARLIDNTGSSLYYTMDSKRIINVSNRLIPKLHFPNENESVIFQIPYRYK